MEERRKRDNDGGAASVKDNFADEGGRATKKEATSGQSKSKKTIPPGDHVKVRKKRLEKRGERARKRTARLPKNNQEAEREGPGGRRSLTVSKLYMGG